MAISTKTNWLDGNTVYAADLNRIENNIKEINTALDGKATRSADQTITGVYKFQGSTGILVRRSISGSWYQNQVMCHQFIINGENTAGMVFNRNDVDKAIFAFNQHGIVLQDVATGTKYTIIHTGNLDLVTSVAPATLED